MNVDRLTEPSTAGVRAAWTSSVVLLFAVVVVYALAANFAPAALARSVDDLGPLTIPHERVPDYYLADPRPVTAGWRHYDANSSADMGSVGCGVRAVQCWIDKAPPRSILDLPSGRIDVGSLEVHRSEIVIRGKGGQGGGTTLAFSGGAFSPGCSKTAGILICQRSPSFSTHSWTGGYARGSKLLTLSSAAGISPGDWVLMRENKPPTGNKTSPIEMRQCQDTPDCLGYAAKVVRVSGNTITIDRGLRHDFGRTGADGSSGQQVKRLANPIHHVGFEGIHFDGPGSGAPGSGYFLFDHAVENWVYDYTLDGGGKVAVRWDGFAARNVMWRGVVKNFNYPDSFGHKMMAFEIGAYDKGVLDTVFTETRAACEFQIGGAGNICAYNYYAGRSGGCTFRTFFFHGDWTRENLLEGNEYKCRIDFDSFWGKQGPRNTLFANENYGRCPNGSGPSCSLASSNPNDGPASNDHHVYRAHKDNDDGPPIITFANVILNAGGDYTKRCGKNPPHTCGGGFDTEQHELWAERNVAAGVARAGSTNVHGNRSGPNGNTWVETLSLGRGANGDARPASWDGFCEDVPNSMVNNPDGSGPTWNQEAPPFFWCQESVDDWDKTRGVGACGYRYSGVSSTGTPRKVTPAARRHHGMACTELGGSPAPPPGPRRPTPPELL